MIEYHVNNNFHIYNWFVKLLNDFPGSMLHQPSLISYIFLVDTRHEKNFWSSKIFSWLCCKNLTLILTIISMIRWDLRDDCDDRVDECHGDDITVMLWSDPEVFTMLWFRSSGSDETLQIFQNYHVVLEKLRGVLLIVFWWLYSSDLMCDKDVKIVFNSLFKYLWLTTDSA